MCGNNVALSTWGHEILLHLYAATTLHRSEGIPSRDISSLGAMDWGLAGLENSSAAVAAVVVALWMDG